MQFECGVYSSADLNSSVIHAYTIEKRFIVSLSFFGLFEIYRDMGVRVVRTYLTVAGWIEGSCTKSLNLESSRGACSLRLCYL